MGLKPIGQSFFYRYSVRSHGITRIMIKRWTVLHNNKHIYNKIKRIYDYKGIIYSIRLTYKTDVRNSERQCKSI